MPVKVCESPPGIPVNTDFVVEIREEGSLNWVSVPAQTAEVANIDVNSSEFNKHTVAVASFDLGGPVQVRVSYLAGPVHSAKVRPQSAHINTEVNEKSIMFSLNKPRDVMLELNESKWTAIHILTNQIDTSAPTCDTENIWYFGPGINQGSAYSRVEDGVNLKVPSGKTVYLAAGAFITFRLNFINVQNASVRGHGFIIGPDGGYTYREHGGAIHMSEARNILVEGVTSLGANGFSLSAGECNWIHVNRYRSFSSAGNGDGIDFFCSSNITIENCFLRNSDDTIALYSHRWNWYGDSRNILIQNCVLLPDIAHAINMGTHGNPDKPETTSNITIRNIDILDHEENQLWYQGCIAINAADMNLFHDIHIEDVRVERITRGQLINLRVMQNAMWTTAPGRGIRDVTIKDLYLNTAESKVVNPSMISGYDKLRAIENVTFQNLRIGSKSIHGGMEKPRWYMAEDLIPLFVNEHVKGVKFLQ